MGRAVSSRRHMCDPDDLKWFDTVGESECAHWVSISGGGCAALQKSEFYWAANGAVQSLDSPAQLSLC